MAIITVTYEAEKIYFKQLSKRFSELNGNIFFTRNNKKRRVLAELLDPENIFVKKGWVKKLY